MADIRFTTEFAGLDDLAVGLDIDGIDDLETLLMILFDRPIGLEHRVEDEVASLEVIVHGNEFAIGSLLDFPVSVVETARSAASTADELGPYYRGNITGGEPPDVLAMSDDELITGLQQALGKVRLANMLAEGE